VIISGALDAFYDVFAEECYNYALKDFDVIEQMELGLPGLKQMFSVCKKSKSLDARELGNAENALDNLKLFIDYKKKAMK